MMIQRIYGIMILVMILKIPLMTYTPLWILIPTLR